MAAICVYCASSTQIGDHYLDLATEVGTRLAELGHSLVSGGGRVSMMGAVAVAARAGGAYTLGVIPAALVGFEVADDDADELVVTKTMRERKAIMDERCDAFLALPGGLGTLEELLEVWTARSLGLHDKPVVVLDPEGFFDPFFQWLEGLQATGFVRQSGYGSLTRTRSVDEAFAALERSG